MRSGFCPTLSLFAFYKLYADRRGSRGVWWRARSDPARAAAILYQVEGDIIDRGRNDARELTTQISSKTVSRTGHNERKFENGL